MWTNTTPPEIHRTHTPTIIIFTAIIAMYLLPHHSPLTHSWPQQRITFLFSLHVTIIIIILIVVGLVCQNKYLYDRKWNRNRKEGPCCHFSNPPTALKIFLLGTEAKGMQAEMPEGGKHQKSSSKCVIFTSRKHFKTRHRPPSKIKQPKDLSLSVRT